MREVEVIEIIDDEEIEVIEVGWTGPQGIAGTGGVGGSGAFLVPGNDHVARLNYLSQTIPNNASRYLHMVVTGVPELGPAQDPEGWLGVGTYDSPDYWGESFEEGTWLRLPPGMYAAHMEVGQEGLNEGDIPGFYQVGLFCVDNIFGTEGVQDVIVGATDPMMVEINAAVTPQRIRFNNVFRVPSALGPLVFAPQFRNNSTGEEFVVEHGFINLIRFSTEG
jgi:hypothetical protein